MQKFRALIVDDERLARQRLRRLLSAESDFEIAGECASGPDAITWLNQDTADLLFLDIQMPGMSGFAMLEQVPAAKTPAIIFVTAYDQFAIQAFEVNAFDYLLKPFDAARFQKALARARAQMVQRRSGVVNEKLLAVLREMNSSRREQPDRLAVRVNGRVLFVQLDHVDWIEAADNYICVHAGNEKHLLRETMNAIEARLDPSRFARIHRSTIVNVKRIKEIHPWFRGDQIVVLDTGARLTLSRTYRNRLQPLLGF